MKDDGINYVEFRVELHVRENHLSSFTPFYFDTRFQMAIYTDTRERLFKR